MLQRITTITLLFCAVLSIGAAQAEQSRVFGDYEVHYNVVNSTFFTPEVAAAYGITRSRDRVVVSVSVRERLDDGSTRPQRAVVTGNSSDLIHKTKLDFEEVDERDAIYYIAELRINDKEKRDFRLLVQPEAGRPPFQINFNKTLYVE